MPEPTCRDKRDWIAGVRIHCDVSGRFVGVLAHGCLFLPDKDHGRPVWKQVSVHGLLARMNQTAVE